MIPKDRHATVAWDPSTEGKYIIILTVSVSVRVRVRVRVCAPLEVVVHCDSIDDVAG